MRIQIIFLALALGSCAAPEPSTAPRQVHELAGRSPGSPQRCVGIESSQALHVSDDDRHILLYGSGRTIWVNNLAPACGYGANDLLITEPVGPSYCRGDIVRSVDRYTRIPGPACVLGDFVPYNR